MVRTMAEPDRLESLVERLERTAAALRAGELTTERAAALVDDCARIAAEAGAELDRRVRAADAVVGRSSATAAVVPRLAAVLMLYPLVYLVLTLPLSTARMWAMARAGADPGVVVQVVVGCALASCGAVDAVVYSLTRPGWRAEGEGRAPGTGTGTSRRTGSLPHASRRTARIVLGMLIARSTRRPRSGPVRSCSSRRPRPGTPRVPSGPPLRPRGRV